MEITPETLEWKAKIHPIGRMAGNKLTDPMEKMFDIVR
jgi:hypothetical protein